MDLCVIICKNKTVYRIYFHSVVAAFNIGLINDAIQIRVLEYSLLIIPVRQMYREFRIRNKPVCLIIDKFYLEVLFKRGEGYFYFRAILFVIFSGLIILFRLLFLFGLSRKLGCKL